MPRIGNPYSDDDDDDDVPPMTMDNADDEEEDVDKDDDEDEDEVGFWNEGMDKCKDLFSAKTFESAEECLRHCKNVHGFNLKVVNYLNNLEFSFYGLL